MWGNEGYKACEDEATPRFWVEVSSSDENKKETEHSNEYSVSPGAGDEARTRYLHLGKVALYQMSYTRDKRYFTMFFANVKW